MFVTFEGIDGSGKSTLMRLFSRHLNDAHIEHIVTWEPANNPDPGTIFKNSEEELIFFINDRKSHIKNIILPALADKKTVLCDRFHDSTVAYQGYGRKMPLNIIENAAKEVLLKPDITFLLDLPVETAKKRINRRNLSAGSEFQELFDEESALFHNNVREGYLKIARDHPGRFVILNAYQSPEEMLKNVISSYWAKRKSHV